MDNKNVCRWHKKAMELSTEGSVMSDEISCEKCGSWEPMPEEWKDLNPADLTYALDGYQCQSCWNAEEDEKYYRNGMAEMNGSGY